MTCCLFVSDEAAEADAEAYDCSECEVSRHLHDLNADPDNARAWQLFHQVVTRFSMETHTTGEVLKRLTADLDPEDFAELMERFAILFDAVCPPPKESGSDDA